jgi:hypothetical protein
MIQDVSNRIRLIPTPRGDAMRKWKLASVLLGLALVASGLGGCAYTPRDGDQLLPGNQAEFIGFATAPSAPVHIQAKSPWTGDWSTIANATADSIVYSTSAPHFNHDMYQWHVTVTVPWFFLSGGRVTLRAEQLVGSSWFTMYMYDSAGWDCLIARWIAAGTGELDVWKAGIECSKTNGAERHEVTLHQ